MWVYLLGTGGAALSALYIGRLVFLTFFGSARSEAAKHAHESPPVMWVPLAVLAALAATAGLLNPGVEGSFSRWLEPVVSAVPIGSQGLSVAAIGVIAAVIAVAILAVAWLAYASGKIDWQALADRLQPIPRLFAAGWYVDEAYSALLVGPGKATASFISNVIDARVIDGVANGLGAGTRRLAASARKVQTGFVRNYALALFAGAVGILVYVGFHT